MFVRQRTKWISSKLRVLDGCSAPFVIELKSNITNRMPKIISFCKKKKKNAFNCPVTYIPLLIERIFIPFPESMYMAVDLRLWYGVL